MASADRSLLLRIDRLYHGAKLADSSQPRPPCGGLSLCALAQEHSVQIRPPRGQAVLAVVGDAGSGKSSFVNALAQELIMTTSHNSKTSKRVVPAEWVFAESVPEGAWPRLLSQAVEHFPDWAATAADVAKASCRVVGSQLLGLEVVEIATVGLSDEDRRATAWIAAHADVVVCLLDSQAKQAASEELLAWLADLPREDGPRLQFVFSKSDLVARESDRIRLIAKVSRTLQERLGKGFEILPIATGDLTTMLDIVDAAETDDVSCDQRTDAGRLRALRALQDAADRHLEQGLQALKSDGETLSAAIAASGSPQGSAGAKMRPRRGASIQLLMCGVAFCIVAGIVPMVLEEDQDADLVKIFMAGSVALGCFCLLMALLVGCGLFDGALAVLEHAGSVGEKALLHEQERFLCLVARQREAWCGGGQEEHKAQSSHRRSEIQQGGDLS